MTDPKRDLGKLFKSDADEALFDDLTSTSKMKEEIKQKAQFTQKSDSKPRFSLFMKKPVSSIVTATAVTCLLLFASSVLNSSNDAEPNTNGDSSGPNILMGGDDIGESNLIEGPKHDSFVLESNAEVRELFGDGILIPSDAPEGFTLSQIHAIGTEKSKAESVIFTYESGEDSFLVIVEKNAIQQEFPNFDQIKINGTSAYLLSSSDVNYENTELHLYVDNFHYMISGLLSTDEAIQVAESLH